MMAACDSCGVSDIVTMKNRPPILAAIDFSSSSFQVLAHAARIAAGTERDLIAVHAVSASRLKDWEETTGREAAAVEWMKEVTERLTKLAAEACGGVAAETAVRIGKAYRVIRDVVSEQGADLLVLGAHDLSNRRLGTVAAHCARSIPADVLILRDWQGQRFHKIAACVDFSRASAVGLGRAIDLARLHQASLEIIHVMFPPSRDPWGRLLEPRVDDAASYETIVNERARSRMAEFLEPFTGRLAEIEFSRTFLEAESPAAAITAHVRAENIDLTIIGSHAGSWVEEVVLGSNAERIMHDSASSVLIARGRVS